MTKPRRRITRHLTYAWVEFGHTSDARTFAASAKRIGLRNLLLKLPRNNSEKRWVDDAHTLIPIRRKGAAVLILPNTKADKKDGSGGPTKEPLFVNFRKLQGETKFRKEFVKQMEFLAEWVFSPGVKSVSKSAGELTSSGDATHFADLVFTSGHGSGGMVWGGDMGTGMDMQRALQRGVATHSDKLKYIVVPTCGNCSQYTSEMWLPALRRINPVHGIFGYQQTYKGGARGAVILKQFAANLRNRRMSVLDAWAKAQPSDHKDHWGAIIHESAVGDKIGDWFKGKLVAPDANGKIVYLDNANRASGGLEIKEVPKVHAVSFKSNGTTITRTNNSTPGVGLFSDKEASLRISKNTGTFSAGDKLEVIFVYIRTLKELDISKLITIDPSKVKATAKLVLKSDLNKENTSKGVDGFELEFTKDTSSIDIPFKLLSDAHKVKPIHNFGPGNFGPLWILLRIPVAFGHDKESFQIDSVTLLGPPPP